MAGEHIENIYPIDEARDYQILQAHQVAIEFADTLGLPGEIHGKVTGALTLRLVEESGENQREILASLHNVAVRLGKTAIEREKGAQILDFIKPSENQESSSETTNEPLNKPQRTWLKKIVTEEEVELVASLSTQQRRAFAERLGKEYVLIHSGGGGQSAETRVLRATQITEFLGGKKYHELAQDHNASYAAIKTVIKNMAITLSTQFPPQAISAAITGDIPTEYKPSNLNRMQRVIENKPSKPKDIRENKAKYMRFNCSVGGRHYPRRYTPHEFAKLSAELRLVLLTAQSEGFVASKDQQLGFIKKSIDKGQKKPDLSLDEKLNKLIDNALEANFLQDQGTHFTTGSDSLSLILSKTSVALEKQEPRKLKLSVEDAHQDEELENFGLDTLFKVVEKVAEHTFEKEDVWAYMHNSSEPFVIALASELIVDKNTVQRALRKGVSKGYFEVQVAMYDEREVLSNIKLTKRGLKYFEDTRAHQQLEEEVLDDKAVWELEMMTDECIRLAKNLGNTDADTLKALRDDKHLFEYTQAEFEAEKKRITELLESLQVST